MAEGTYTVTVELQYRGNNDIDSDYQLQCVIDATNAALKRSAQIPPTMSHDQPAHGDPSFEAD